jgi:transcriptional regulator with XRE-family HTH domain
MIVMKQSDHPLRAWRRSQEPQVTLTALAVQLEVSASHLSEIENWNNEPSLALAAKLHGATKIEMKDFAKPKVDAA